MMKFKVLWPQSNHGCSDREKYLITGKKIPQLILGSDMPSKIKLNFLGSEHKQETPLISYSNSQQHDTNTDEAHLLSPVANIVAQYNPKIVFYL